MCSGSEDKFGHVIIWIIMTCIKEHYKANMSEATPELPHRLLNTWVWFRWRFGAGLWCCSALTVTEMGTHILQVLSLGKRKKGRPTSRTGGWLFTAPDTQETNTQVTPNPQVFPGGRRRTSVVSQHLALGAHAALGEMPCGAETGKT